jgi:hypothetical protein
VGGRRAALALAATGGLTLLWIMNRRRAIDAVGGTGTDAEKRERGADLLARMAVVELGNLGTSPELAGMMWVALNRANAWGAPLYDVLYSRVQGRSEFGSGCKANPNCDYNQRLNRADDSSAWPRAHKIAKAVMGGFIPRFIGDRMLFIHPNFPGYASQSPKRPLLDPETGRYLPLWSIGKQHGGQAPNQPMTVGKTPTRFT